MTRVAPGSVGTGGPWLPAGPSSPHPSRSSAPTPPLGSSPRRRARSPPSPVLPKPTTALCPGASKALRCPGGGGRAGKAAQEVPVPVGTWVGPGPLRKGWSRGSEEKGCWGRRGEWWVFKGSTRAREASGAGAGLLDRRPKKAGTTLACLSRPAQCQAHSRCLIGT